MGEALYRRLGGAERIASIVEEAIDRHAVNPVLAPRLRGKDLPRLARAGTRLFCAGIGGPARHSEGGDLRSACARLDVSELEYRATMGDIVAALASQGVPQAERVEVVAILDSLKGAVLRT
jgi:truncated hemoglobin YjbI